VRTTRLLLLCAGLMTAACSGASSETPGAPTTPTPPTAPTPSPQPPAVVTITGSGFSPLEVSASVGSRVTFFNADSRPHELLGGPDHARQDCAEIDVVGFLVPGQSRETAVFTGARLCEFHDHANVGNPAFTGRIVVR
jgi:plastocyanin